MADYIPNYETPIDGPYSDLDPAGGYPGKKRSWKERLGQIASLSVWNPDDEAATKRNNMQLTARAGNREVLHEMTQNLIRVNIDPQEAAKMANQVFASKYMADIAANEAAGAAAENKKRIEEGYQPHTRTIGMNRGAQDEEAAAAATFLNQNMGARAKAQGELGVPAAEAFNDKERANATLGELQQGQIERRLGHKQIMDKAAEQEQIDQRTGAQRLDTAVSKAAADAAAAEAGASAAQGRAALMRDPKLVERLTRMEENKALMIPTPYGGEVHNLPFPEADGEIAGQAHMAPGAGRTGQVGAYRTLRQVLDRDGKVVTLEQTRTPLDSMQPPALILAPQVQPNLPQAPTAKKPIRIIGN